MFKSRRRPCFAERHNDKAALAHRRRASPEERKEAILEAALGVFAEQGFAATRLEDVAAKAGVAKGTLYLYFTDKAALFEELLLWVGKPLLAELATVAEDETVSPKAAFLQILRFFHTQILGTPRERILRLIITEGYRFPRIAKFHYQNIITPGRQIIVRLAARGHARGEFASDALAKFPQLFFAPVLLAVVWNGMFSDFDPLDAEKLLQEHAQLLFGEKGQE